MLSWGRRLQKKSFTKKKPVVDHMRIFGTPMYIHVPKEKRAKLEPFGKVYLSGTVIARRPIIYMYLDRGTLKSADM